MKQPICPNCGCRLEIDPYLTEKFNKEMYRCPNCWNVFPEYKVWWCE